MRRIGPTLASIALVSLAAAAASGCRTETRTVHLEGDAGEPGGAGASRPPAGERGAERRAPADERGAERRAPADERGAERRAPADERGAERRGGDEPSPEMDQLERATRDFLAKVDERAARGWPASVRLTSDAPPRPTVRVQVRNETSSRLDGEAWAHRVSDLLVARGSLAVTLGDATPGDAAGDEGVLLLLVSVREERRQDGDTLQTDRAITLKLEDPAAGPAPLVMSISSFREVRER